MGPQTTACISSLKQMIMKQFENHHSPSGGEARRAAALICSLCFSFSKSSVHYWAFFRRPNYLHKSPPHQKPAGGTQIKQPDSPHGELKNTRSLRSSLLIQLKKPIKWKVKWLKVCISAAAIFVFVLFLSLFHLLSPPPPPPGQLPVNEFH